MSDQTGEPEHEPAELTKTELREQIAGMRVELEVLRAANDKRRPLVDTSGMIALGLIIAGIVLTVWSTLDPEVAFTGIAGLLAGGGLVAAGKAID